jgi:hypothetical protein
MRNNNLYLERIIKRAIFEQNEKAVPPPVEDAQPAKVPPPVEDEQKYFLSVNKQKSDGKEYTSSEMKSMGLSGDIKVWKDGFTNWTPIKDVPELSDVLSSAPPVTQNKAPEPTDTDVAAAEGFFKYCPNVAKIMKSASETLLSNYTKSINAATDPAEQERLKAEAYEKMAESNKNDLKSCESEFKSSKTMTNADKENVLGQYRSTINNLLRKTASDLGKKALVGGVNLATSLITKKLGGVSNAVAESLIKKNTKNNLIEIYNRKNRRRY